MTPFFTTLSAALATTDQIQMSVSAVDEDTLRVILTPKVEGDLPDGKDADLRAALSLPLVITEKAETLDERFPDMLREYATQRASLQQSLDALDALKQANAKAGKQKAKAEAKSAPAAAESKNDSAPASAGSDADDDILL